MSLLMTEWFPHEHQTPCHGPLPVQLLLRHGRPAVRADEPWRPWAPSEKRCSRSASLAGPTWRTGVLAVSQQQRNTKKGVSPRPWHHPHHLPWQHRSPSNQEWWEQLDHCLWVNTQSSFLFVSISVGFFSISVCHSSFFLCCPSFSFYSFLKSWLVGWLYIHCMYAQGIAYLFMCVHVTQSLCLRRKMWVPSGGSHWVTVETAPFSLNFAVSDWSAEGCLWNTMITHVQ